MISMLAGRALGDILLMPMFGRIGSDSLNMHWVMLLGMYLGNVCRLFAAGVIGAGLASLRVHEPAGISCVFNWNRRPPKSELSLQTSNI